MAGSSPVSPSLPVLSASSVPAWPLPRETGFAPKPHVCGRQAAAPREPAPPPPAPRPGGPRAPLWAPRPSLRPVPSSAVAPLGSPRAPVRRHRPSIPGHQRLEDLAGPAPPRPPLQEAPATPSPLPAQPLEAGPPVTYACAGPRAPGGPRQRLRGRGAAAGCSLSRSCRGPGGGWGTGRRKRRRRTGGGGGGCQGERGRGRRGAGHPAAAARTQALLLWPATLLGAVLPGPPPQNLPRETRVPPPGGWGERKRRGRRKEVCVCVCVCSFLIVMLSTHPRVRQQSYENARFPALPGHLWEAPSPSCFHPPAHLASGWSNHFMNSKTETWELKCPRTQGY